MENELLDLNFYSHIKESIRTSKKENIHSN